VVLGVSSLFTSSGAMRGLYINLIGRSDLHVANALLGLTALLPLSWVLSQHYGALGAAISMSIACALNAIAASFLFEPTRVIGRIQLRAFLPRIG
jgi:O-antigen/teichoic acid export membrane protein